MNQPSHSNYMKKMLGILFLLIGCFLFASNFNQSVTTTAETCAGNGAISINITGANAGTSQFTFKIYNGTSGNIFTTNLSGGNPQNTTAATANFNWAISGFTAGTYRVETTETDGSNTKIVTTTFTIGDQKRNMVVSVAADQCAEKTLTATLTQSSYGPYTYTLLDSNSNVLETSPSTNATSYSFSTVLPNGSYTVSVKDLCGNQQIGTYVINAPAYTYDLWIKTGTRLVSCTTKRLNLQLRLFKNGNLVSISNARYPITVKIQLNNFPDSQTVVLHNATEAGDFFVDIPFYTGQDNSFTMTVTDSCPFIFTKNFQSNYGLNFPYFDLGLLPIANTCKTQFNLSISRIEAFYPGTNGYKVTITSNVPGFDASQYNSNFNSAGEGYFSDFNNIQLPNVPAGLYTVTITDECGHTVTKTTQQTPPDWQLQKLADWGACTPGSSTVSFGVFDGAPAANIKSKLTSFSIIAAPQVFMTMYNTTLPYNADSWIYNGTFTDNIGRVYANALPAGTYTFQYTDACEGNTIKTATLTVTGTILQNYATNKTLTCNGVSLNSTITSNYNTPVLYLQQYFPATGKWGYPQDPTRLYTNGTEIFGTDKALALTPVPGNVGSGVNTFSSTGNIAVTGSGHYRVILEHRSWLNGIENGFPIIITAPYQACQTVMEEFDVNAADITVNNFIVITCIDGTNNLIIDAAGVNLSYQIIEKDGVAFVSPASPQSSPVFTSLQPGKYKVRISDSCGRQKVVTFFVVALEKLPVIQGTSFCAGQPGKLYIEGYNFLTYQWYKNGVAIPGANGTGYNTLNFPSYDPTTEAGIYSVKVSLPGTCLDKTLYYTIKPDGTPPNAGTGQTVTIDISTITAPINLFNYLTGPYDNSGIWTETTIPASGQLSDYIWNAQNVLSGTYTFNYTVNSTCTGAPSVATVTINITGHCTKPGDFTSMGSPTKVGITNLQKQSGWPENIPNGFIALESKTSGFVITRVQNASMITDPKEGMLIYDIDADCVSLYNGTVWRCIRRGCND
ncbi:hypothetical protein [Chryseobacterium sp. c4a]|uniref:hypothetical protein n=1 Tax=Chryseobacterium sp. c4a TaxID=1573582 RepID=UPI001357D130|nr:hypothetical protein [Chryseobacterium sp. c4a]